MNKKIVLLLISFILCVLNAVSLKAESGWNDDSDFLTSDDPDWNNKEESGDTAITTQDENNNPIITVSYKHKNIKKPTESIEDEDFPSLRPATGVSVFIFDPQIRRWAVYDANGHLLKTGRGSGGRNYCPDIHRRCHTPVGEFEIYDRQGAGCKSKKFPVGKGGAPMPYCSYFYGGYAIHGSYDVKSYNASHGCIRIYPKDAKWLQKVLPIGSTVIIKPY